MDIQIITEQNYPLEQLKASLIQNKMDKAVGDVKAVWMERLIKKMQTPQQQTHIGDFLKVQTKGK